MTKNNKFLMLFTLCAFAIAEVGCESAGKNTVGGAGAGALVGAVAGTLLGGKNKGQNAAIGAVIGAGIGGTIGHRMDKQQKELAKIAETKRTEQGLVTKLKSDILFDTGKASLKPQANDNLAKMSGIMKKYPENVLTIKGYTDSTGSPSLNKSLSEKRAESVKSQLVAGGIPGDTISVVGMGPENPVAENKTTEGRAKNRRVEIEVTVDESKVPKEKK